MILKYCRICQGKLKTIIDLGRIALVGELLNKVRFKSKKYKIKLCYCIKCKHVQISQFINPNKLFRHYLWETGVSSSNLNIIKEIIKRSNDKNLGIKKLLKIFQEIINEKKF